MPHNFTDLTPSQMAHLSNIAPHLVPQGANYVLPPTTQTSSVDNEGNVHRVVNTPSGDQVETHYTMGSSAPPPPPRPPVQGLTQAQVDAMIANALAQHSSSYQGQINDLLNRLQSEQQASQQAQAEYLQRLREADDARQEIEQRVAYYTSPEFLQEGTELAREHMLLGQEADQERILQTILQGMEGRGMVHSGVLPGLQQKAAQYVDEQYSKKALDIAQQLAMMGVQGAEGEFSRYLQQLGLEHGALTSGQQMSWNQLSGMMGFATQADQFSQGLALQQFTAMAPYMLMTQNEKASHVRQLLQQMGVPAGGLTDAELNEIFDSIIGGGY